MSYYPDLGVDTQISTGAHVRAVGWLSPAQQYPRGKTTDEFIERLEQLCEHWGDSTDVLGWPVACGPHQCEFCNACWASGNFGVPGDQVLYVAPEMIGHYCRIHEYRPPDGFVRAVLRCPDFQSAEYAREVASVLISDR